MGCRNPLKKSLKAKIGSGFRLGRLWALLRIALIHPRIYFCPVQILYIILYSHANSQDIQTWEHWNEKVILRNFIMYPNNMKRFFLYIALRILIFTYGTSILNLISIVHTELKSKAQKLCFSNSVQRIFIYSLLMCVFSSSTSAQQIQNT